MDRDAERFFTGLMLACGFGLILGMALAAVIL
jgi:hypothetical protein